MAALKKVDMKEFSVYLALSLEYEGLQNQIRSNDARLRCIRNQIRQREFIMSHNLATLVLSMCENTEWSLHRNLPTCDEDVLPRLPEGTFKEHFWKDKDAETIAKWKHCAITQQKLVQPIVSCELGRLYNKDSVIEYLLCKDSSKDVAKHIRSLKDIVELKLTVNAGYSEKAAEKGDEYIDVQASGFICPVAGLEMNGRYKFLYLRGCGCVFSDRAFKAVKSTICNKCGKPFSEEDKVIINGTDEEMTVLEIKMSERRIKAKLDKRSKKHKLESTVTSETAPEKITKIEGKSEVNGQQTKPKISSSNVSAASKLSLPQKATTSYCIAKDPKASEAYKSLFTTHKTATNQQKAHWVTHNPLYY